MIRLTVMVAGLWCFFCEVFWCLSVLFARFVNFGFGLLTFLVSLVNMVICFVWRFGFVLIVLLYCYCFWFLWVNLLLGIYLVVWLCCCLLICLLDCFLFGCMAGFSCLCVYCLRLHALWWLVFSLVCFLFGLLVVVYVKLDSVVFNDCLLLLVYLDCWLFVY